MPRCPFVDQNRKKKRRTRLLSGQKKWQCVQQWFTSNVLQSKERGRGDAVRQHLQGSNRLAESVPPFPVYLHRRRSTWHPWSLFAVGPSMRPVLKGLVDMRGESFLSCNHDAEGRMREPEIYLTIQLLKIRVWIHWQTSTRCASRPLIRWPAGPDDGQYFLDLTLFHPLYMNQLGGVVNKQA